MKQVSLFTKRLVMVLAVLCAGSVFAEDAEQTEDVAEDVATVENATSGKYADFLDQAALLFKDGVFTNPAYEEVNTKFPLAFKLMMGLDGKVFSTFYTYRQLYMQAEKRLAADESEDAELDMFQMAYAYEILSCIGDLYIAKGKVKTASDATIDNQILKEIVSQKVQSAPAELWKFLLFANKTYLPKDNTTASRVKFASTFKGEPLGAIMARWGFVNKVFKGYRAGEYKDKKVK